LELPKLHIGTGTTYLPGWKNVDVISYIKADLYANAMSLPYSSHTFDLIYASHVLEHFNRHLILAVLEHWKHLLKTKGILRLAVPDFEAIIAYYMKTNSLEPLIGLLYGGQRHIMDAHQIIFTKKTLTDVLKKVGFKEIREWDWRTTEHADFDDYSQAHLPHMDKANGLHMSLNLEAIK
jgi:predicted SAM-dependent methyltransferase